MGRMFGWAGRVCAALELRPMLPAATLCIAGIWMGVTRGGDPRAALGGAALLLAGAAGLAGLRTPACARVARWLGVAGALPAAWAVALLHPASRYADALAGLASPGDRLRVWAVVVGDPDWRQPGTSRWQCWNVPLAVERVQVGSNSWRDVRGRLSASWLATNEGHVPAYGEQWQIQGRLLASRNVSVLRPERPRLYVTAGRDTSRRSSGHGFWLRRIAYQTRRTVRDHLRLGFGRDCAANALTEALVVGYRGGVPDDMRKRFAATGTLHLLAISGMHVGIFGGLVIFLLRAGRIPRTRWALFLGPILAAYSITTGGTASALRATMMATVYYLAPAVGRRPDTLSALAASAVAVLLINPMQIHDRGFALSFVCAAGLVLACPLFDRLGRPLWMKHPFDAIPDTPPQAAGRTARRYLVSLAGVSCAAWLASAPLHARFFGQITPIALLGNLVVVPLAFLLILGGCLAILAAPWAPPLAVIFNHATWAISRCLEGSVILMARVPPLECGCPPLWAVWLWYAVLAALVVWGRMRWPAIEPPVAPPPP